MPETEVGAWAGTTLMLRSRCVTVTFNPGATPFGVADTDETTVTDGTVRSGLTTFSGMDFVSSVSSISLGVSPPPAIAPMK